MGRYYERGNRSRMGIPEGTNQKARKAALVPQTKGRKG